MAPLICRSGAAVEVGRLASLAQLFSGLCCSFVAFGTRATVLVSVSFSLSRREVDYADIQGREKMTRPELPSIHSSLTLKMHRDP